MPDSPLTNPSSSPGPPPSPENMQTAYNELGDSDSELSALTEDEGDADETAKNKPNSVMVGGKSNHTASVNQKDSNSTSSTATSSGARKSRNDVASGATPKSGVSGRRNASSSGKRKRSSIVPAPMWGWAEVRNANVPGSQCAGGHGHKSGSENGSGSGGSHHHHNHGSSSHSGHSGGTGSVVEEEEEEEEEVRGPPAAMEEEEDEDNSSGSVPGASANGSHHHGHHGYIHGAATGTTGVEGDKSGRRAKAHKATHRASSSKHGARHKRRSGSGGAGEADHAASDANALSASEGETEGGTRKRSAFKIRGHRASSSRKKEKARGGNGDDDYVGEANDSDVAVGSRRQRKGIWIPTSRRRPPVDDGDMESLRDSSPISDINGDELNMDATAPSANEIGHITAAAAASSIMAGSGVIFEPGDSPHASDSEGPLSRSATPPPRLNAIHTSIAINKSSPSRMASNATFVDAIRSPAHLKPQSPSAARRQAAEALGDLARDASPTARKSGNSPGKTKVSATATLAAESGDAAYHPMDEDPPLTDAKTGEDHSVVSRGEGRNADEDDDQDQEPERDEDADQDQEPELEQENENEQEQEPEGEADQEQEQEQDAEQEQEGEQDQGHDQDQDQDQDGEQDLEVDLLESDLQPAHRAEALDVLASIELKFALLRERVYVEKMENLVWEEELIIEGTHPELIHLQKELTKRKAKRLELAFKKREYEVANAKKRRRVDEDAVWSWWMSTRDDLQTEMIAEANRKRRKLERERRALERPQPVRRIPQPLEVHINPPPSIRKIMRSFPFSDDTQDGSHKKHSSTKVLAYPEVTSLSSMDVASDLDFIYQQRRQLNAGLSFNQPHLQPGAQMAPTLYDIPAPLYGGHHILGPGRPGPGVGIIGPGGMNALPPALGVSLSTGLNHIGVPGMSAPQHGHHAPPPAPPSSHGPPGPPPHPAPPNSHQQQMQVPTHPLQHPPSNLHQPHSHQHQHQHIHHSHPHTHSHSHAHPQHASSAPPGPSQPGPPHPSYTEYHEPGGPMYGPGVPASAGRPMPGPPPPMPQSSAAYQHQHGGIHPSHGHPRDKERDREREREREHQGDMSPFPSSFSGPNGPGSHQIPPSATSGSSRHGGHAPSGYGRGYGHRGDGEYEYERERDRDREMQRRDVVEHPLPPLAHHSQPPQTGSGTIPPPGGPGGYVAQPYYGSQRDHRGAHPHAHGGSNEPQNRREAVEGREKDVKDTREGGRRSISPVNIGPTKQPWMGSGVGYDNLEAMDIDEEERMAKERDRRDRERKERDRERDRERERETEREYQQEMEKREYSRQQMAQQNQHRHGPPPPHPQLHHVQHNHHPVGTYHQRHGSHHHHVVHHHHGQSQPPPGSSGHGASPPHSAPRHSPHPRDYEPGRPHSGPILLSTEAIHPTSNKPGNVPAHWKTDEFFEHREREREREMRTKHSLGSVGPPISGRPPSAPVHSAEDRDRPLAVPFAMTTSNVVHSMAGPSQPSYSGVGRSPKTSRLGPDEAVRERERDREREWEREREWDRDSSYRLAGASSSSAPPGYQISPDGPRSPVHRYAAGGSGTHLLSRSATVPAAQQGPGQGSSVSHSPPRSRQVPLTSVYPRSPTRYGPPPQSTTAGSSTASGPTPGQPPQTRSPPISLKLRPSLPSSNSTSPKGSNAFSSSNNPGNNPAGVYSPVLDNVGPRPLSPRKIGESPPRSITPLPTVSTPPGSSAITTKPSAPLSDREKEKDLASSPGQTSHNVGTSS